MTDDEQFDKIIKEMADERGITPEEMESRLIAAAQAFEKTYKTDRMLHIVSILLAVGAALFIVRMILVII